MLNAVRRGPALARAFRACAPRLSQTAQPTSSSIANTQKHIPLKPFSVSQIRSFQSSNVLKQATAAAAARAQDAHTAISDFAELGNQGLVHPRVIYSITDKMGINSMTDVQKLTILHSTQGLDV